MKVKILIILKWMHLLIICLLLGWLDLFTLKGKRRRRRRRRRKSFHMTKICCKDAHPFCGALSRRRWQMLHPIKLIHDPLSAGWPAQLTASAFNRLHVGQYASSPGNRAYCYAELAVFFSKIGRDHRLYSLRLPMKGWPGWVDLCGWLNRKMVRTRLEPANQSPVPLTTHKKPHKTISKANKS